MPFGKHKGKSVWQLILNEPSYIHWLLNQERTPAFDFFYRQLERLVSEFNRAPFIREKCSGMVEGSACTHPATQFTLNNESTTPVYWCEACCPKHVMTARLTVTLGISYQDALTRCKTEGQKRKLIKELAIAKGLEA